MAITTATAAVTATAIAIATATATATTTTNRYTQSNFNSDNCLVGGATVDYGPFGFVEKYDPGYAMWIGAGQHFAFENQGEAAERYGRFGSSLLFYY
jgi:uncharacterized protein YdiU (UPF0061 family)